MGCLIYDALDQNYFYRTLFSFIYAVILNQIMNWFIEK